MKKTSYTTVTVYVKDSDIELYEAAKKKGSISSIIAEALRQYLSFNQDDTGKPKSGILKLGKDITEIKESLGNIEKILQDKKGGYGRKG